MTKLTGAMKAQSDPQCHPLDRTDARLRAYLASMEPLRGCEHWLNDIVQAQTRGRSHIELLAAAGDTHRRLRPDEVANVLAYISGVEPIEPGSWWSEPDDGPSHVCGFYDLLSILEDSLRAGAQDEQPAAQPLGAMPLMPAVETQRQKLLGVLGTLQAIKLACRGGEPPDELEAALELLEDETQRIVTALEESELRKAAPDEEQP